ncbi:hypothetical protein [Spirosoma litoris]
MKFSCYTTLFALLIGLFSCKGNDAQPEHLGLPGTWVMFKRDAFIGDKWVAQSITSSTVQTITFTNPNQLSSTILNDTTLTNLTYFEQAGSPTGIVGVFLLVKKTPASAAGKSFYYTLTAKQDTLRLTEFGQTEPYVRYSYGFRRL